jgi:cell division protease FtsH
MDNDNDEPPSSTGHRGAWIVLGVLAGLPFVALLVVSLLLGDSSSARSAPASEPLSQLAAQIRNGQISSIEVIDDHIAATSASGQTWSATLGSSSFLSAMEALGVTEDQLGRVSTINETASSNSDWFTGVLRYVPYLLMASVLLFLVRRGSGIDHELWASGKSHARRYVPDSRITRFDDVAGIDDAKQELQELVDFLRTPLRFTSLGARIPKGVLLSGPPGCGKTLLARAVAGEAGVPFLSLSGSEFVELVVGVGASRVRDLFNRAKEIAPCIVFIDEIDAVAGRRDSLGADQEREQTLNQILVEMDGFDSTSGVIVLAASNRADLLDPALLRPGRFDRRLVIAPPDVVGRRQILEVQARHVPLAADVDLSLVPAATSEFSGADLANVINEAAILAVRHKKAKVGMTELETALDRVNADPEHQHHVAGLHDRLLVAYHTSGQALVMRALSLIRSPRRISLLSSPPILAAVDTPYRTRGELNATLTALLAGRAAERVAFGDVSTTANEAIHRATDIARAMVVNYGMSSRLGELELARRDEYAEMTAEAIDGEVHSLIETAYATATDILKRQHAALDRVANALNSAAVLEGDDLERIVCDGREAAA